MASALTLLGHLNAARQRRPADRRRLVGGTDVALALVVTVVI